MASISLRNINKIYAGDVQAVQDFNLEILDKEFVVFVGPSGCGKSTTLRMIAGLEDITSGELYIDDVLMNDAEPKDRDIAMVFQNYAIYPHMTVYENMAFGLKIKKLPKNTIDEKVKKAAEILNITELLDRKPKALSGGQRQRVALGRAIVREPKVFLLDEPLSNLDAKMRTQMRAEITKLHNDLQTTFVYVTHDQVEAMTMGTKIVVMKDGVIQQVDSPENLYDKPVNKFVAGFIGTPQMNFIDGIIVKENNKFYLTFGCNKVELDGALSARINQEYIDKSVYIGIRAEDLHLEEVFLSAFPERIIKAEVKLVEKLGNETLLYVKIDGKEENIICRAGTRSCALIGDIIDIAIDTKHIHIFAVESELNISL